MAALWPDTAVADANLTQTVFMLRKVLGDKGEGARVVVTVPGRGYRFVAEVRETGGGAVEAEPAEAAIAVPVPIPPGARGRWLWLTAAVLLPVTAAAYVGWRFLRPGAPAPQRRIVLAVLPFQNLTGDAAQEYFGDGLTEEMITQLGRLDSRRLAVIARTSVMRYKNSREDLGRIGRELGAEYILEGSVRRDSSRMRIAAQLIQVKDQTHLWAREYDRELTSLLIVQGEIAQEIADEIQLTLGGHGPPFRPAPLAPKSYAAYDLYLKGRYFWNKRTADGFRQAVACFEQAAANDPTYARVYAGLADSYALMSSYFLAPHNELMPKARRAALRALQLDDSLAEAHASLALIVENYDWDWQTAEKEFRRSIQLDPNYATAHHWYAEYLAFRGRFDEAFAEMERARQLDPLSPILGADKGAIFYYSRQYGRAIEQARGVLEMEPHFSRAQAIAIAAYVQAGRWEEALKAIDSQDPADLHWGTLRAYVNGRAGRRPQAQQALAQLESQSGNPQLDVPPMLALAYLGVDNTNEAMACLEKAYLEHSNALTGLKVDPVYDPLRGDARFQDLVRRVGLSP